MTSRQVVGFLVLCLASSATWLAGDVLPSTLAPAGGEGFRLLLVGAAGVLVSVVTRSWGGVSLARCGLVGGVSLGLIGIPFLLLLAAEGKIGPTSVVVVFAGMPILLTVADALSADGLGLPMLPAGLMGIGGLLILLPIQVPRGATAAVGSGMLLLAVALTAGCLTWLHRLLADFPVFAAIGLAGIANALLLMLAAGRLTVPAWDLHGAGIESLRCLVFDLPQMTLLLWLAKGISPQRLSARYVMTPLLTVLEGLLLLRPRFEMRTLLGVIVLGFAGYLMLRSERDGRKVRLTPD